MSASHICPYCGKLFLRRSTINRHLRLTHKEDPVAVPTRNSSFHCSLCKCNVYNFSSFEIHVLKKHNISLKQENLVFQSITEFYNWKNSVEEKEKVSFIQKTSERKLPSNCSALYLHCNRSGFFKPKPRQSDRIREVKRQGSCKINGFCPSRIKAKCFDDGKVTVEYCSTHVGHGSDLAHVPLTYRERLEIADKLANEIPADVILEDVRSTVSETNVLRKHLLTKRDLSNIKREFELHLEDVQYTKDIMNISSWVETEKLSDTNCILLYKPHGKVLEDYNQFKEDDFALVIMTQAQEEMLTKFGGDCICIDGTESVSQNKLEIVTLLVIDEKMQGFPCAFFICNRINKESVESFILEIKNKIGLIDTAVFMSDITDSFYNVWKSVMKPVETLFYCSWHVDRAWKNNLKKIKNIDKKKETYKNLRWLLEEPDINAFMNMFEHFVQQICDDEDTKKFGEYFCNEYQGCYSLWAYCYRGNDGVNKYLGLERIHQRIKDFFSKGKSIYKLDGAIHKIMQMVKRLTVLEKKYSETIAMKTHSPNNKDNSLKQEAVINCRNTFETNEQFLQDNSLKQEVVIISQNTFETNEQFLQDNSLKQTVVINSQNTFDTDEQFLQDNSLKQEVVINSQNTFETDEQFLQDILVMKDEVIIDEGYSMVLDVETEDTNVLIEIKKTQLKQDFEKIIEKLATHEDIRLGERVLKNFEEDLQSLKQCSVSLPVIESKMLLQ